MNKMGIEWSAEALAQISDEEKQHIESVYQQEFGPVMGFAEARKHIIPVLKPAGSDLIKWEMVPHTPFNGDIEVTYYYLPKSDEIPIVGINNAWLEVWGVSPEMLHRAAVENMESSFVMSFRPMADILTGLTNMEMPTDFEEKVPMYVLGNEEGLFGASVLLSEKAMSKIALRDDYYILPSSIHECILVPKDKSDLAALQATVREVNRMLKPDEYLADYVFSYDVKNRELYRAQEEAERGPLRKKILEQAR